MKKHSFTLVELLVVVGIIALLAGLIIPAVGMAQTSARRTACLSNQGQVMKIMRSFMNEGDKQILPNSLTTNGTWTRVLFEKNKLQNDLTVARCPSIIVSSAAAPNNTREITPSDSDANKNAKCQEAYGMIYAPSGVNGIDFKSTMALKCDNGTNDKDDDYVVAPNQLALGGCSARLENDQVVARALIDFNGNGDNSNTLLGRPVLVHGGQTNIFFLDGHTESLTKDALSQKYFTSVTDADTRKAQKVGNSNKWILDPDAD
jgi:prepilin-type processing-associated H-X9-DG protein